MGATEDAEEDALTIDLLQSLNHPLRIQLFHALTARPGAATAAQLAADVAAPLKLAEKHLGVLADHGVIERDGDAEVEVEGSQPYWRPARASFSFDVSELGPESQGMVERLHEAQAMAHAETLQRYFADRGEADDPYRQAAFGSDMVLTLTLAQFEQFQHELVDVLMRYRDAAAETAPDARHVFAFAHAFPLAPWQPA